MKKEKSKDKVKTLKEFFYAIKVVYRIDKLYIFQKMWYTILSSINAFAYAYVIRVAVSAIEKNQPREIMFKNVLIVTIVTFLISFFRRTLDPVFWYKGDRIAAILRHKKKYSYLRNGLRTIRTS